MTLLALLVALLAACESKEQKGATAMIERADSLFQQKEYEQALAWLDSLAVVYPDEVECRKEALRMSREIRMERSRQDSVIYAVRMEQLVHYTDSLYPLFEVISVPDMPDETVLRYRGYHPSKVDPKVSFLDVYVANNGTLELIASTSATYQLGVTYIQISESLGGSFVVSDTLQYDGGLNYRFEDLGRHYERLTFAGERAMPLAAFVAHAPEESRLMVELCREGKGRVASFGLSKQAQEAIAMSYRYAKALQEMMEIDAELRRHDRRLFNETQRQLKEGVEKLK